MGIMEQAQPPAHMPQLPHYQSLSGQTGTSAIASGRGPTVDPMGNGVSKQPPAHMPHYQSLSGQTGTR
jgi:hypothetical protein